MVKQIISLILAFAMASLYPASLLAQEADTTPKLTDIKKGEAAPFDGVLFNSTAAAELLASKKYVDLDCKLKIDLELEKQLATLTLRSESLQISLDASKVKYDSIIEIKDNEIARLNDLVVEASSTNVEWWVAGGFLVGTAVSLGIFFAAAEAGK